MPELRPFRGLRYDPARVPDLAAVLCPPYDVISGSEREALLARSPTNAVRLELPAETPAAARPEDLDLAAATLRAWTGDGTLRRDERPLVYVYEQRLTDHAGAARVARSFFCRLALEEYGPASSVKPHERTLAGPREHRFALLRAVRTHLSPVLMLYDDGASGAHSARHLDVLTARPPDIDTTGPDGAGQRLWAVDPGESPEAAALLQLASAHDVFIADGHHRYETALRYSATADAPPDARHVMALLYDAHSGGLEVAPWHRLISGLADTATTLAEAARRFVFEPADTSDALLSRHSADTRAGVIGLWTRRGGAVLEVRGESVGRLDVSVLSDTLPGMIGATQAELTQAGRLTYTHDAAQAVAAVNRGEADMCFLLRPTPVDQVMAIASDGGFMPPKSTYFYPKAATGLVFDPLDP